MYLLHLNGLPNLNDFLEIYIPIFLLFLPALSFSPGPLRDCLSQALLSEGSGMILIAREIALPAKQLNSYRLTPLLYGLATGDPLWLVTRLVRVNYHKA